MKFIIILMVIAVAGYFFYKKRHPGEADAEQARDIYVCKECGETHCECHKEKQDNTRNDA
ncbi:MAG: hypothetical protein PF482_03015 [Desulfobacteraceae bacterium]|jgi:uncharacterized protein YpmB|nr:hypothetical protein [Desulfobacteraceae bacterium]